MRSRIRRATIAGRYISSLEQEYPAGIFPLVTVHFYRLDYQNDHHLQRRHGARDWRERFHRRVSVAALPCRCQKPAVRASASSPAGHGPRPSRDRNEHAANPSHIVKDLLESGYKVRGTVRSDDKGEYLKDLFKGQPFEYVIAKDITEVSHDTHSARGWDPLKPGWRV